MGMSLSTSADHVGTVWVTNVTAGSPAAVAGIKKGDLLVMAGGVPVVAAANSLDSAIEILMGLPKVRRVCASITSGCCLLLLLTFERIHHLIRWGAGH